MFDKSFVKKKVQIEEVEEIIFKRRKRRHHALGGGAKFGFSTTVVTFGSLLSP